METQQRIVEANSIFENSFLNCKTYYMYSYNKVPCITWADQLNTEKVLKYIKAEYAGAITGIFQNSKYDRKKKKSHFFTTIIMMKDDCLVELGSNYCEVLHTHEDYEMANALIKEVSRFKRREKKKNFEINLISKDSYGLELKSMEIKKSRLNLDLFYEDDFKEVDKTIQTRLAKKNDKGIVLLHGLPGSGKTTYLRYLIGRLKKKVLFVSPATAGEIMNPELMDLLIDNPDSVLIIEDAENIIMDRKNNSSSSVSNLLNISDGLLADFLNVQLICTFNSSLTMVDSALMRQGRLIAKYEFGKLGVEKAKQLSKHFGFDTVIDKPMTIAEIANPHEKEEKVSSIEVVGFRRQEVMMN
ncbi:MAG: AAA family ATPase [Chitinophagaceae bacterium]